LTALWRISFFSDLEGLGGERVDARWHTAAPDKRIVYLAEHPALALIEVLVNMRGDPRSFPTYYQLMKIAVSEGVATEILAPASLSDRWPENTGETRFAGDAWLAANRTALLRVPSAPSPESTNYLFNPLHPDAKRLTVEWRRWIEYDQRLFHTRDR
jgi:RES domain-containing protein